MNIKVIDDANEMPRAPGSVVERFEALERRIADLEAEIVELRDQLRRPRIEGSDA